MNVCLSNGTDWIGQELFYFITCWDLNNAPQKRAYLRLPFHLIQHVSQIFSSLSLSRHSLCDHVKRQQAFTWYLTCEFCGAWHPVFGQLMEWTSGVSHAAVFVVVWVGMGFKGNFMILVQIQIQIMIPVHLWFYYHFFKNNSGKQLKKWNAMLTAVFCHQIIISVFNKSEVSLITFCQNVHLHRLFIGFSRSVFFKLIYLLN